MIIGAYLSIITTTTGKSGPIPNHSTVLDDGEMTTRIYSQ